MQALLLPASPLPPVTIAARCGGVAPRARLPQSLILQCPSKFSSLTTRFLSHSSSALSIPTSLTQLLEENDRRRSGGRVFASPAGLASPDGESEKEKLAQAPPRAEVVKSLKNGIMLNVLGMGAAILGMQATVGLLVAKALTSSAVPYYQGMPPGQSPVLALDVFLVQASANTILSHFLGLVFSLELLRSVTLPNVQGLHIPKAA